MAIRLTRREVLAGGIAGVAALPFHSHARETTADDFEIIDCHTHFYDPTRPEGIPWPPPDSELYRTVLPQHLREQKQFRPVTGTVVIEASSRIEDNAWLLKLADDDPFVVGVVGRLDPGDSEFASQLKRFAANPLFRGIRVSVDVVRRLLADDALDNLKRLAAADLALDVNGGPDTPAMIAQLAPRLPELQILLNHIGNVAITAEEPPRDWQAGIRAAARHANVFCKVSALVEGAARGGRTAPKDTEFYAPYLDVVWSAFGADRVIYGSDWPVSERAADYSTQQRIVFEYFAAKGPQPLRKFFASNAKRTYKWPNRPGRC